MEKWRIIARTAGLPNFAATHWGLWENLVTVLRAPTADHIAVLESDEGRWRVYLHEAPFVEFQSRDEAMAMFKLLGG